MDGACLSLSVFITTTVTDDALNYFRRDMERLQTLLGAMPRAAVRLVDDPAAADRIIFVGAARRGLQDVTASALYRRHRERCCMLQNGDAPLPVLPGIYASVPCHWYDPRRHRSGFYLRTVFDDDIPSFAGHSARWRYSFMGAGANHPVREALLRLDDDDGLLLDSAKHPVPAAVARARYVASLRDSQFVLCPRGGGTSSFRIFETLRAGRVPVILSDDWVEPAGPDWGSFSLRVREADVSTLPSLLAKRAAEAAVMGQAARKAWEQWFSPQAAAFTLLRWLEEVTALPATQPRWALRAAALASGCRERLGAWRRSVA
jgi:glycosyltransferase involved in cell wall biosynthesis